MGFDNNNSDVIHTKRGLAGTRKIILGSFFSACLSLLCFCSGSKEVKLGMILNKNILFRYRNLENDFLRHDYFKS